MSISIVSFLLNVICALITGPRTSPHLCMSHIWLPRDVRDAKPFFLMRESAEVLSLLSSDAGDTFGKQFETMPDKLVHLWR
jgi:hypothetical protein